MAYSKLVFTILCQDNKYEVYAVGEGAPPQRIIHYQLQEAKANEQLTYEWVILNSNYPIPRDQEYQISSNLIWYFESL
ncbi:hypothetical protein [Kosakonia sp. MUSA4]|uniref:hypothetical protein n=1 Tax=Kosakonia sp. MUSA4 TaxID=2067958 RepID=UPI0015977AC6|nr:hypothetical protein [Kosakonia sp. MUSA4]QJT80875.1 hypothetical protein C0557_12715 [Kosakonia sp. MUSA4]